jgi:CBS-domain-containing membrane protein
MDFKGWMSKEKRIWHAHFLPSLFAGLIVAFLSVIYQMTVANIVLFASVGASATILTNDSHHHLTKLRTTILAYIIAIVISLGVYTMNQYITVHNAINLFLLVFLVALGLFLFDSFHPPAITASLSFILLEHQISDLLYLLLEIILLLIAIRFITYVFRQGLPVKKFLQEFTKSI